MSAVGRASLAFALVVAFGACAVALPPLGRTAFEAWLWFATAYFVTVIPLLLAAPLFVRLWRAARRDDV